MENVPKRNRQGFTVLVGVAALFLLGACGTSLDATPTPPATATPSPTASPSDTPDALAFVVTPATPTTAATVVVYERSTLPPSWTPTSTPTASLTPTITLTPSITTSPTPSPTLTNRAFCRDTVVARFEAASTNTAFAPDDRLDMVLYTGEPGASIRFEIVNEATGRTVDRFTMPANLPLIDQFDLSQLPGPGTYTWSIEAQRGDTDGLCTQRGTLRIAGAPTLLDMIQRTRSEAPETTPEATAETTP